ncbi:MAG: Chloride channel protein [Myxococcaceae bacterium]|nr:Chloride channel protein [Myxococcaceae bacterium]
MSSSSTARQLRALAEWTALAVVVGLVCGSASALFLALLELVTRYREAHVQLVYLLPAAGLAIGSFYQRFGQPIEAGNNLVIDTIHDNGPELPLRMAPMVLVGTVLTHLFGGSAGREGTAVQMGASLADALSRTFSMFRSRASRASRGMRPPLRRALLAAGVAGGFGSVFGTPIAGALFGLEFVVLGRLEYQALWPVLVAALVGDLTTRAWGIEHTHYPVPAPLDLSVLLLLKWLLFAAAVALVSVAFVELTHLLKRQGARYVPALGLRSCLGGVVIVLMWKLSGTSDYLGLGVPMIVRSFSDPSLPVYAFAAKLLFTAVTLGSGFLGGEVTPLFFVGAALGNVLARLLDLPLELAAGVGMAAMFASAAKTPLALSVMAVELLGASLFPHAAIVCVLAYVLSGRSTIYPSQRLLAR